MPSHKRLLAVRTAVVAATSAAAALFALLPAAATPAAATPAPAVVEQAVTPAVGQVRTVALSTPAATTSTAAAAAAPAARRATALQLALSKVGAAYRWGAAGPSAFDCSGLMYWAFKNAGVTLPRTSRAMSTVGAPVAKSALQPGDLVFFYRPVSHVAMYIGNGKFVHASTSGQPVKISNLSAMPFTTARRV